MVIKCVIHCSTMNILNEYTSLLVRQSFVNQIKERGPGLRDYKLRRFKSLNQWWPQGQKLK